MKNGSRITVIIPAFNEEPSIGKVIAGIPDWVDDVIVADNNSGDRTAEVARAQGARVVSEPRRGYGSACLAGIAALDNPDVVVFLDGDFSDYPDEMGRLIDPIINNEADLVIGSRVLGQREPGALTPQAQLGNWLACALIRLFWKVHYTDLGPFRAIRTSTLKRLRMRDRDYGWTVEMQIKAAREGIRVLEVPVSYRRRIGASKISGTVKGVLGAGTKILSTIFLAALGSVRSDIGSTVGTPENHGGSGQGSPNRISIVIPTLNEATILAATLFSTQNASNVEVIVVDGGSQDGTVELARSCGARVLTCPAGRARQMNTGAALATGSVLLFLHADTCLPQGFDRYIHQVLSRSGVVAGAFELLIDAPLRGLRIIEWLGNWRSKQLQMPYGDQGIFLRASLFHDIGGFPDIPIMEDFELIRRLRQQGRILTAPVPAVTSARRWKSLGIWKTTLINQAAIVAYSLGVAPSHIARWYHWKRG